MHLSVATGQSAQESQLLISGREVEREIAGGQSHTYRINAAAGQFVGVRLEQKGIDLALELASPDDKTVAVTNLTRPGGIESLSVETSLEGDFQLTIRALAPASFAGGYLLRVETHRPTPEDKQRIAAERLLVEANPLVNQGDTASRAIELLNKAVDIWLTIGDPYWQANSLNLLGRAYHSINVDEKAIEYAQQGLALHLKVKNRAGQASALNTIGTSEDSLGRYEKAIAYREQALAAAREVKDKAAEAIILSNLTNEYEKLGQPEKTIAYVELALPALREVNNRLLEGRALGRLGFAHDSLGREDKAIEYYEQALLIAREVKDRIDESNNLRNLSNICARQGRNQEAREYAEQSLVIARAAKNRPEEGAALSALGITYHFVGEFEKSLVYIKESLAIAREIKNRSDEIICLSNIGNDLLGLDRKEEAIKHFEQALVIAREMNLRHRVGEILLLIGSAYIDLNDKRAEEYLEQALAITVEIKDRLWELESLNKLARLHQHSGKYDKAKEYAIQALAIARETNFRGAQVDVLSILAEAERDLGNLGRARSIIQEASQILESDRSQTLVQEARSTLSAYRWYVYDIQVDVLMRLHKENPAGGFDVLAIEANERTRARSLLEMLKESGADIRRGVDPALLDRERSLARQLNARAAARTQLVNGPPKSERMTELDKEIVQIETDYERVKADIRKTSPHYAALIQPQPLNLKDIQAQLDTDTLLLEYSLGEQRSYLWAVTKDSLTSYELPNGAKIRESARVVHELLSARTSARQSDHQSRERVTEAETRLPTAAAALSKIVLEPVASQLGNKRLVIVADGALQYIPYAMLPEPGLGVQQLGGRKRADAPKDQPSSPKLQAPLIVNHEIVNVPSASTLAIQRAELSGRRPAPKTLAVIADPVFDRTDERLKNVGVATNDNELQKNASSNDIRSIEHLAEKSDDKSAITTRKLVIPRLPYTRQEATQLLALTPRDSSFGAVDFQASRATVLDSDLSQYRYVHFATHGLLDTDRPGLSSLVLSMFNEQGKQQDGFLRANDVYNLKLPAELVVLSACQTGLGKEIKGEGLVGLTRGFMYAGAARVVVSMWNVNDKATSELMTKFYEKMLKHGKRPAAALREAQVEMWKQKQWHSPYYWAAFTMQGEWR